MKKSSVSRRASVVCLFAATLTFQIALAQEAPDNDNDDRPMPKMTPPPRQHPEPPPLPAALTLDSAEGHGGAFTWQMARQDEVPADGAAISQPNFDAAKDWAKAVVPGTVLTSLVHDRVYPEPYFGTNNQLERELIPDIADAGRAFYTYWFRTAFDLPEGFATDNERHIILQMDGVNYRAEVWLNGQKAGHLDGMFTRGFFDVTALARPGAANVLAVLVQPVDVPGKVAADAVISNRQPPPIPNGGNGLIGQNTTMLMSTGWNCTQPDGVRDRNTGIWRSVKIYAAGPVDLRGSFVKTRLPLPATSPARETVSVEAVNLTDESQEGTVKINIPAAGVQAEKKVTLAPNAHEDVVFTPEEFPALAVENPELWWPFSKGNPALYALHAEFVTGEEAVSKALDAHFGIREVTSSQETPDHSRLFFVNGQRFFVHGSNWLPEAMLRTSKARTDAELRYTRQAGIDFLRLWGGGIAESDDFFDRCDELGILVWTEFWQTGETALPADADLYRANVADTVRRLRGHPSLAYYVSADARREIVPIKDLLDQLDGTRGYQPQSDADGTSVGGPVAYVNPMRYYDNTACAPGRRPGGFNVAYGAPCLPTADTLREMMEPSDLWPINKDTWDYLDGGGAHRMTTAYDQAIRQYGEPRDLDAYAWQGQMVGAASYRAIFESQNRRRLDNGGPFNAGFLFWCHDSPAPQVDSRFYSHDLEPTAALYAAQSALEPVHAQFDFATNTVSVNNQHPAAFNDGRLLMRVFDSRSKIVAERSVVINVPPDSVAADVLKIDFPADVTLMHFIRLDLYDDGGKRVADTFYWRSTDAYDPAKPVSGPLAGGFQSLGELPPAQVEMLASPVSKTKNGDSHLSVKVRNTTDALAFFTQVKLVHTDDGKPVRPAFYSNNFFSLLPGEQREVQIDYPPAATGGDALKLVLHGTNVPETSVPLPGR